MDTDAESPRGRHLTPPVPGEVEVPEWPSRWIGWIIFAGVMMIVLGMFHAFQGFIALFDDDYYLVTPRGLTIHLDYAGWGWIHLGLGVLVVAAGIALLNGRLWGRIVGVVLSVLSLLVNVAFLAAFPIWSTIMMAVDILVIWSLTVHGQEMHTMLNRTPPTT
ncbi:hypothetical protein AB0L70_15735 [Kribbella sp. NPDC051952]|uniref:DUF7144 family membrane protein n=1 Tax=Kribbella sp. NPDC051952 TaxID=3154851 RepID=UPI003437AECE